MSAKGPPLQLLSASGFSALISLRRYMSDHGVAAHEAITALAAISSDFASGNSKVALALHDRLPAELSFEDIVAHMRTSIALLIETERPWWRTVFPAGRGYVASSLNADERQAFDDAGLFLAPPTPEVMAWWYRIEGAVRAEEDIARSDQGGNAELWTIEHERMRLAGLGINREPELVGFDNHSLGYDVKSFDLGSDEPVSRLIEVKSTVSTPPRMIVSRGEWKRAIAYGQSYFFYLWWGDPVELAVLTTVAVADHIPKDQGEGEWLDVEVEFDPSELRVKFAPV